MKFLRDPGLAPIVEKVEAGQRLTFEEGMQLFETRDLNALMRLANLRKEKLHGDKVFFVHSMRYLAVYCMLQVVAQIHLKKG